MPAEGTIIHIPVCRGVKGLGLAVNASNKVAEIAAGGQAEVDGLLELGDEVISIDGIELAGRPMGDVIPRGAEKYDFVVSRSDVALAASMGRLPEDHPVNVAGKGTLRLLQLTVVRDANGLGLDMSGVNMLKKVVPGGAADKCGGWLAGDLVVAVDHKKLAGRRLVDVMPRGMPQYAFTVLRADEATSQAATPAKATSVPVVANAAPTAVVTVATASAAPTTPVPIVNGTAPALPAKPTPASALPPKPAKVVAPAAPLPDKRSPASAPAPVEQRSSVGWGGWLLGNWGASSELIIRANGEEYGVGSAPTREVADGIAVFSGRRVSDRQEVSVKRYTTNAAERENVTREVSCWKMLSSNLRGTHVNIVGFHGTVTLDGFVYLVRRLLCSPFGQVCACHHICLHAIGWRDVPR